MCDSVSLTESSSLTFGEFLKQKQLTPNLVQYILYSIAMVTEDTPTLEVHVKMIFMASLFITSCSFLKGLQAIKVFINSLGRFGNAPFLFPIFGGGELPQAFCRYCHIT